MASKEDAFDDDLDIDGMVDVDEGDEFSMDGDINPDVAKSDRNPVTTFGRSALNAAKENLLDRNNIERFVEGALPREFGDTRSFLGNQADRFNDIYEQSRATLKRPTDKLKKQLQTAKKLWNIKTPEFIDKWLEVEKKDGYSAPTQDQIQDDQILRAQAEIFKLNQENSQEERIQSQLQTNQLLKQGDKKTQLLDIIAQATSRLSNYQDQIGTKFQQKQLELGYRQFFALQNIYNETKAFREDSISHLSHIMKNTSLPDIVKAQSVEVMKDIGLRRFLSFAQESASGQINKYFGNFNKNLKNAVARRVENLAQGLDFASDAISQANDIREIDLEMQEMTGEKPKGLLHGLMTMAGQMFGDDRVEKYRGKAQDKLKEFLENRPEIQKAKDDLAYFLQNKEIMLSRGIKDRFGADEYDSPLQKIPTFLREPILDILQEANPSLAQRGGEVGFHNAKNLNDLAEFDNRTQKSITEIIPGYLARILQSSEGIRTGQLPGLTIFSHERDTFIDAKVVKEDIKRELMKGSEEFHKQTEDVAKTLVKEGSLTPEQMTELQLFLTERYRSGKHVMFEDFFTDGGTAGLSGDIRNIIQRDLQDDLDFDEEGKLINGNKTSKTRLKFSNQNRRAMGYLPSMVERMKQVGNGGVGYTDILKELNYVDKNGWNEHNILVDNYFTDFLKQQNPQTEQEAEELIQSTYEKILTKEQLDDLELEKQRRLKRQETKRKEEEQRQQKVQFQQNKKKGKKNEPTTTTNGLTEAMSSVAAVRDIDGRMGVKRLDVLADVVHLNTTSSGTSLAEETLGKMSTKFQEVGSGIKQGFDKLTDALSPHLDKAKTWVGDKKQRVTDLANPYIDKGKALFNDYRDTAEIQYMLMKDRASLFVNDTKEFLQLQKDLAKLKAEEKYDQIQSLLLPYIDQAKDLSESGKRYLTEQVDQLQVFSKKKLRTIREYGNLMFTNGQTALTEAKLKAGEYYDVTTNRIITSWDQITGEIKDLKTGDTVLTLNEIGALCTEKMESAKDLIKGIWDKRAQLPTFIDQAKGFLGQKINQVNNKPAELWANVKGEMKRILDTETLQRYKFFDIETGERIQRLEDIKSGLRDQYGNIVVTIDELRDSAYLMIGDKIEKLSDAIPELKNRVSDFFTGAKQRGLGWWNQAKEFGQEQATHFQQRFQDVKQTMSDKQDKRSSEFEVELLQLLREQFDFTNENLLDINQSIQQLEITGVTTGFAQQQPSEENEGAYTSLRKHVVEKAKSIGRRVKGTAQFIGRRFKNEFVRAKNFVGFLGTKSLGGVKSGLNALKRTRDSLSGDKTSDIYIYNSEGQLVIALEYRKMLDGGYINQSGRVITSWDQLTANTKDTEGNIVLNADDIRNGLFNSKGKKIDTRFLGGARDFLWNTAKNEWKRAGKFLSLFNPINFASNAAKVVNNLYSFGKRMRAADVYIAGEDHPRLFARAMKNGEYTDQNGKTIDNPTDISGNVYDREGNVLISAQELSEKGIVDVRGKPFKTVIGKITSTIKGAGNILWNEIKRGGRFVKGLATGALDFFTMPFKHLFKGYGQGVIDPYTRLTYELLAWKYGAPDHHADEIKNIGGVKGRITRVKDKIKSGVDNFKKKFDTVDKKMRGWDLKNRIQDLKEAPAKFKERINGKKDNDVGEDGKYRKGSWRRFFQDKENQSKDKPKAEGKEKKGLFGGLLNKVGLVATTLIGGFAWLKSKLTDAFSWLPKIGESLFDMGKWFKNGLPKLLGSVLKDGVGGLDGPMGRGRGKGLTRGLTRVAKIAGVAGVAYGAYSTVSNLMDGNYTDAAIDGALTAGGVALMVGGKGLAAGGAAVAGALGAIPVLGWAALAVIGVTVGAYFLWQSFKGFDAFQKYKLASYGIHPDDEDNAKKILTLESLVYKATTFDKEGNVKIKMDDFPTWCASFWNEETSGSNPSEAEYLAHVEQFEYWWKHRFYPVYSKYAKVAKVIQPDAEFDDLEDDLDDKYKAPWAKRSFFNEEDNRNPYTFKYLPFSDKQQADTGPGEVKYYQTLIISEWQAAEDKARKSSNEAKRGDYTAWWNPFGNSKEDARDFDFEKRFDDKADTFDGDREGNLISRGSIVKVKNSAGELIELTAGETQLDKLNSTLVSDIFMIRLFFYGLRPDNGTKDRVNIIRELEALMGGYVKVSADGKTFAPPADFDYEGTFKKYGVRMGWDVGNVNDQQAWTEWFKYRFLMAYVVYLGAARNEVNAVIFENIDDVLKNDQLVTVVSKLTSYRLNYKGEDKGFFNLPLSGFKSEDPNMDISSINSPLKAIKDGVSQRSLLAKPTKEELEASRSRWQAMAKRDAELREGLKNTNFDDVVQRARNEHNTVGAYDNANVVGTAPPSESMSTATTMGQINTSGTGVGEYTGSGDVKGIKWSAEGKRFGGLYDVKQNWENLKDLIPQVAKFVGVDAGLLTRIAQVESGFSPTAGASTSSAKGLYQFTRDAWSDITKRLAKLYGLTGLDIHNPIHNAIAGAQLIKDSMPKVKKAVAKAGLQPTAGAFYASHFMGQTGMQNFYSALAKDPNAPASAGASQSAIKSNPGVFFKDHKNKRGLRTLGEVAQELERRTNMDGAKERAEWAQQQAGQQVVSQSDANYGTAQSSSPTSSMSDTVVGGYVQPQQTVPQNNSTHTTTNQYDGSGNAVTPPPANVTTSTPASNNNVVSQSQNLANDRIDLSSTSSADIAQSNKPRGIVDLEARATPELVELGKHHTKLKDKGVILQGMNETFMKFLYASIGEWVQKTGNKHVFQINDAFRTFAQQAELFKKYGPGRAARPGNSKHESGVAIDIQSGARGESYGPNADFSTGPLADWENSIGKLWGFHRPLRTGKHAENWHVENKHFPRKGAKAAPDGANVTDIPLPGTSNKQEPQPYNGPIANSQPTDPTNPLVSPVNTGTTTTSSSTPFTGNIMDYGLAGTGNQTAIPIPQNLTDKNQIPAPLNPAVYQQANIPAGQSYRWMDIAFKEIGQVETKGSGHNPRIQEYMRTCGLGNDDETPWCSGFVNWVMKQAGYTPTGSAAALSWKTWKDGDILPNPCYGSIAVFSYGGGKGHVGFVVGKVKDKLAILGGNQSDSVRVSGFNKNKIIGYVLPKGITPNYNLEEYKGPINVYNSVADELSQTRGPVSDTPAPLASGGGTTPAPYAQPIASPEVSTTQTPSSPNVAQVSTYNPVTGLPQTVNQTASGGINNLTLPQTETASSMNQGMGTNPNTVGQVETVKDTMKETNDILRQSLDVQRSMDKTLMSILGIMEKKPQTPVPVGQDGNKNHQKSAEQQTDTTQKERSQNYQQAVEPSQFSFSAVRPFATL